MVVINDVRIDVMNDIAGELGTKNFRRVDPDYKLGIYPKIVLEDTVSCAFHPRYGYILLETDKGQAELYLGDFSEFKII